MYSLCQTRIVLDSGNTTITKIDIVSLGDDSKDFLPSNCNCCHIIIMCIFVPFKVENNYKDLPDLLK